MDTGGVRVRAAWVIKAHTWDMDVIPTGTCDVVLDTGDVWPVS